MMVVFNISVPSFFALSLFATGGTYVGVSWYVLLIIFFN